MYQALKNSQFLIILLCYTMSYALVTSYVNCTIQWGVSTRPSPTPHLVVAWQLQISHGGSMSIIEMGKCDKSSPSSSSPPSPPLIYRTHLPIFKTRSWASGVKEMCAQQIVQGRLSEPAVSMTPFTSETEDTRRRELPVRGVE